MSPQWKFITWYGDLFKRFGLSELTGRIAAVILLNRGKEVSLQELADQTEYSLSALSQSIDIWVRFGFVERRKKKGDRRAFFYMNQSLPEIIRKFLLMGVTEEIIPAMHELTQEIDEVNSALESAENSEKEELVKRISTIEELLKEIALVEKYLRDLGAVKLPKSD